MSLEGATALAVVPERNKKKMGKTKLVIFIDYTQVGLRIKIASVYVKTVFDGKLT